MPAATVTVRELRNKDTGIDLSIPSYKEVKGMLGSSYEYQVMVVSKLSFFKTAKHKESDNVQFVVSKKFADFEELYSKMNTKYSGTAFPPLPKRVLMVSEAVAKERRSGLEYIIKFLAMTPKLCTCPLLLEFLGVSPNKVVKLEVSDKIVAEQDAQTEQEEQGMLGIDTQEQEQAGSLFEEEEEEEDSDMFAGMSAAGNSGTDETKIFDEPELRGGFEEGDDDGLFLVDAKVNNTLTTDRNKQTDLEDNSHLFEIDDDLDKIMTLNLKPKPEILEPVEKSRDNGNTFEVTDDNAGSIGEIEDKVFEQSVLAEHEEGEDIKDSIAEIITVKPEIKSKPKISQKQDKFKVNNKSAESEINFDDIVSGAEKVVHVNVPERPKPAIRKRTSGKGKQDVPKQPVTTATKPIVPKRPEINPDKPNVPKRPEIIKEKPSVPKRPEVIKDKPRPEVSVKPKVTDKQHSKSEIDDQVSEEIETENDVLKYIQDNTAIEEDVDLFS